MRRECDNSARHIFVETFQESLTNEIEHAITQAHEEWIRKCIKVIQDYKKNHSLVKVDEDEIIQKIREMK